MIILSFIKWYSMNKTFLSILILFFLGVFFRLWLIHLVPQPVLIGDQYDYNRYAIGILHNGLFALSSRLYGYPLFLALIYAVFGEGNTNAVIFIQALVDTSVAFLVFWMTQKIFKVKFLSYLALFLYLFNPFTSAFSGLILTEVLTIFLTISIFALFFLFLERKSYSIGLLLSFLLGFLPQVRPPFLFFTLFLLVFLLFLLKKEQTKLYSHKMLKSIIILAAYVVPYLYTIFGNKIYFDTLTPVTTDNIFVREFYISMFIGRSPSHDTRLILDPPMYMFPQEVKKVYVDIANAQSEQERKVFSKKYFELGVQEIEKDPKSFFISHFKKMWYVWEKHYIFYYFEPLNKEIVFFTYWGNIFIVISAVLSLILSLKCKDEKKKKGEIFRFYLIVLLFFFYITVLHIFSLSEERYSLPAYPLIFVFSSFAIYKTIKRIKESLLVTKTNTRNGK